MVLNSSSLFCFHFHPFIPPPFLLSILFFHCIQCGSNFFMLPLSGTSPFLINNSRTENSSVFQCSHRALALLLNYSQNQFSSSVIKNTSYCHQIDSRSEDRNGSVGEEKLCHVSTALVCVFIAALPALRLTLRRS